MTKFDQLLESGTGHERQVNPYDEMRKLLGIVEIPEGIDELELQELCGFFGLTVAEFKPLYLEFAPLDAFICMLQDRGKLMRGDEEVFSDEALRNCPKIT